MAQSCSINLLVYDIFTAAYSNFCPINFSMQIFIFDSFCDCIVLYVTYKKLIRHFVHLELLNYFDYIISFLFVHEKLI